MKKKQLFIIAYFLWWIFIYFFTNKVLRYFDFHQFIIEYRWYALLITLAYLYYRFIMDDEDKRFQQDLIKRSALYLTIFLFIRPLLNIAPFPFLIMSLILWWLRKIRRLDKKIKLPLLLLWGFIVSCILISWVFYLYPDPPDFQWFIEQQAISLHFSSSREIPKTESYLQVTEFSTNKVDTYTLKPEKKVKSLNGDFQVIYASNSSWQDSQIFLLFENGQVIKLFPQSILTMQNNKITLSYWTWALHDSRLTWNREIDGITVPLSDQEYEKLIEPYQKDLANYLFKQINQPSQKNKEIRSLNKKFLTIMEKVLPGLFYQNLQNFDAFSVYRKESDFSLPLEKYQTNQYHGKDWIFKESINIIKGKKDLRSFSNNF